AGLSLAVPDLAATRTAIAGMIPVRIPRLAGDLRLSARLDGSADDPSLAVNVRASRLSVAGRPLGELDARLRGAGDRPSEAHLDLTAPRGAGSARARLSLRTPLRLGDVLRKPPGAAALARTPIDVSGEIDQVPLALLAPLAPHLPRLEGTLSSRIALSGPARAPTGSLFVSVDNVAAGGLHPTDGRVAAEVRAGPVQAHARLLRAGRPPPLPP